MGRPLRKDAAERRSALLSAARAVFEEEGIDAPLDRIAERAGVGRATLYRNFPGRTEIATAVLLTEFADLKARFADASAAESFFVFLRELSARLERNAALSGVFRASPSPEILAPLREALVQAGAHPLAVSQAAGLVRRDLGAEDVRVLAAMLGSSLHNVAEAERAAVVKRSLELVTDAVRARP